MHEAVHNSFSLVVITRLSQVSVILFQRHDYGVERVEAFTTALNKNSLRSK